MKNLFFGVIAAVVVSFAAHTLPAQCVDVFSDGEKKVGYRVQKTVKDPVEDEKKTKKVTFAATHILAGIDKDVSFKISLDSDLTSAFSKPSDFVSFTVMENVYGDASLPSFDTNGLKTGTVPKRCVVIQKGAKIYGMIDVAHSRYPFNIGGKGKIFVTINNFKLEDGKPIYIKFVLPPALYDSHGKQSKNGFKECKYYPGRMCIAGRREKLQFPPGAIAAGTSAGLLLLKDDSTTNAIAGLSFIDSISQVTGINSLVNPPNAGLNKDMIFEVITEGVNKFRPIEKWVDVAANK